MKRFGLLAVLVLVLGLFGCAFGNDGEDTTSEDTAALDTTAGDTTADAVVEDAFFKYVAIADDPDNIVTNGCNTNPGADIDCVELMRGGTTAADVVATAGSIVKVSDLPEGACETNDKDDETEVLGAQNGVVDPDTDTYTGYFSLNGREIWIELSNDEYLQDGDTLHVVEMYNPDNPNATIEKYTVSVTDDTAGEWLELVSGVSTGETLIDIVM